MAIRPTYEELEQRVHELEKALGQGNGDMAGSSSAMGDASQILETILKHTHMMAVLLDAQFNFIWVNRAYAETCRQKPSFFHEKNHFDLYPDKENQKIFQRAVETGEPFFAAAKPFAFPDQPERGLTYWDWSLMPIKDESGKIDRLVFTLMEVTDRIRAQESLRQSEALYRSVTETVDDGIILQSSSGEILTWNQGAERIFGIPATQAIGKISHEMDWKFIQQDGSEYDPSNRPSLRTLQTGKHCTNEIMGVFRPSGELRWISINTNPLFHPGEPRPYAVAVSFSDITGWKHAQEELLESERRFRNLYEQAPMAYQSLDTKGRLVEINQAWLKLLGYTRSEAIGRWFGEFLAPFEEKAFVQRFPKFLEAGEIQVDIHLNKKDGREIIVQVHGRTTLDDWGQVAQTHCILIDITEKKEAERKYQMLFHEMLDGFALHEILCDDSGSPVDYRFLAVNPAFEKLTGLKGDDLLGKTVLEVMPDTEPEWIETYGQVAITGDPISFERYAQELDRYFQIRAFRPAPNQFACIFVDATQRILAQNALKESTERFQTVFHSQLDAILVLNAEVPARVVESNRTVSKLFGYDANEMIGDTVDKLYIDDAHRQLFQSMLFEAVKRDGRLIDAEFTMKRKDGTVFPSEHTVFELKNNDGKRTGWVAIIRDLTERKEMESRLQQAQKMESIGNLAGGIAHDFNNILFPIVGIAELLLEDLPEGSAEYENAQEILSAGKRGSELVKQILAFSRQSEHKMIPVHVQQVLKEALKLSRSTIPSNIAIDQQIQHDCPMVMADPTQLHQIAMNLITNAFHAVESTGGAIAVTLTEASIGAGHSGAGSLKPGRYALLTVSDTGSGIDPVVMDKIFDPYFTTKSKEKGTGLGLAVVYGIIREHGGDILVDSKPGEGATFSVYIPQMGKSEKPAPLGQKQKDSAGNERILLVDDEPPIVRIEKQMLSRLGYSVTERTSSIEALAAFQSNPRDFDLVISDMTMPNMTGDEFARKIIEIRPDIPVVICTGFSERINEEKASRIGIKGLLMKPVIRSELAKMVRKVLDEAKAKHHGS